MKKIEIIVASLVFCLLLAFFILSSRPSISRASVMLTIVSQNTNGVTVVWPNTNGYVLQTNGSLIMPDWNTYGGAISNSNGTNTVTIQPVTFSEFFRLASNAFLASPTQISNMAYYWNYKKLPSNSPVNSWTDDLRQLSLVYNNGGVGNGVFPQTTNIFPGLYIPPFGNAIAFTNNLPTFGSNFTLWIVMRPWIDAVSPNEAIFGDGAVHGINLSINTLSANWGNTTNYSGMPLNYSSTTAYPYGQTYDILDSGGTLYSNGVPLSAGLGQPINNFPFYGIGSVNLANGYTAKGYIQYIGIWTNHLLNASDAQSLDYWYWNYGVTNITNGLVGWWKLNDGSGTKAMDFWGTNTMIFGGTGNTWTNNAMVDGGALYFSGNGWLTNVSTNFANNLPAMTISFWVNESGLGGNGPDGAFIQKGVRGGDGSPGFELGADGVSNVAFGCYDLSGSYSETPHNSAAPNNPIIGDNNWHFIVGAYTNIPGTGMVPLIYIDGAKITGAQVVSGITVTNISALSGPLCIGAENMGNGTAAGTPSGILNDMRIYNRVLSMDEVQDLYKWRGEP